MNARINSHHINVAYQAVRPFSHAVTSADTTRLSEGAQKHQPLPHYCDFHLTKRETQVLSLIASGYSNKQAARELGISPYTIAGYIKEIYRKLHISSRAEATIVAIKLGLLDTGLLVKLGSES